MRAVRTWLPAGICLAGVVVFAVRPDETGLEGGLLLVAAGLSVWLLNWFYLVSVRGERDRDVEDAARDFYDAHGHWPDEEPPPGPDRRHEDPGPHAPPGPAGGRAGPDPGDERDPHHRAQLGDAGARRRAGRPPRRGGP